MKRPLTFIVGTAAAAMLIAAVGASAHGAGPFFSRLTSSQGSRLGDNASGARTESPEPTGSPESRPPREASPAPEPTEAAETDSETSDTDTEARDTDAEAKPSPRPTGHDGDGGDGGGGGGD